MMGLRFYVGLVLALVGLALFVYMLPFYVSLLGCWLSPDEAIDAVYGDIPDPCIDINVTDVCMEYTLSKYNYSRGYLITIDMTAILCLTIGLTLLIQELETEKEDEKFG